MQRKRLLALIAYRMLSIAGIASLAMAAAHADNDERAFLPRLVVSSTIPANGDLNPYGVAFVPQGFPGGGAIAPGDVLVSNFNNSKNLQGTGTTIVKLTPNGIVAPSVAAGSPGNAVTFFTSSVAGLSTALGVLRGGFVLVGNVPTTDGMITPMSQGSLQVIDRNGNQVNIVNNDSAFLDSPWDLAINDNGNQAQLFVSNVLSGTVSRLDLAVGPSKVTVLHKTVVAMGYAHRPDANALVLGPTGLAYDKATDILYVASTADNTIFAVPHAGRVASLTKGTPIFANPHLRGPLALVFAPNGNLLTANGDAVNGDPTHPSEIVEFTKSGEFVREFNVDASQGGAFGIATVLAGYPRFNFAAVDDVPNTISVYYLP